MTTMNTDFIKEFKNTLIQKEEATETLIRELNRAADKCERKCPDRSPNAVIQCCLSETIDQLNELDSIVADLRELKQQLRFVRESVERIINTINAEL